MPLAHVKLARTLILNSVVRYPEGWSEDDVRVALGGQNVILHLEDDNVTREKSDRTSLVGVELVPPSIELPEINYFVLDEEALESGRGCKHG